MTPDSYPAAPGFQNTDTSREAAQAIAPSIGARQARVLEAIRSFGYHGLTTNELADHLNVSRDSIQPRTSELKGLGLIADSGSRRRNANGKKAIVWIATNRRAS